MATLKNILEFLKGKGHDCSISDPPEKIRRIIRWAKRSFNELEFSHVAPGVYLVDEKLFEKVYAAHQVYRSEESQRKATKMAALNEKLKLEKESGMRDNRGRLITTDQPSEETKPKRRGRPPLSNLDGKRSSKVKPDPNTKKDTKQELSKGEDKTDTTPST